MQHLLVIVLNEEDLLDEVLSALVECEIPDAAIIDGVSMQEILVKDIPIFAGLLLSSKTSRFVTKVIISSIPNPDVARELNRVLKAENIDLTQPEIGYLFVLPVSYSVYSSGEEE